MLRLIMGRGPNGRFALLFLRVLRSFGIMLPLLALSACDALKADFTRPGGAVSYFADGWIPGANKKLELYRATVAFAFFSAVGTTFSTDQQSALSLYHAMSATMDDLKNLAGHLYPQTLSAPDQSTTWDVLQGGKVIKLAAGTTIYPCDGLTGSNDCLSGKTANNSCGCLNLTFL